MRDLLLPRTDAAVLVQALVLSGAFATALLLARRNRELLLLVIGLATITCGLFGLRALHCHQGCPEQSDGPGGGCRNARRTRVGRGGSGEGAVMAARPKVVLFDVVETMFSLRPVAAALEPLGLRVETFFARLLRDGFALAAAGTCEPFRRVAGSAVAALAPEASPEQHDAVLAAFGQLPAHPDVEPALSLLAEAGVTVCALTNGSSDATVALLEASGLRDRFEQVLSVEEVREWKPAPAPYRYALDQIGVDARDVALVAVHSWDVHGAHRAGLTTGWCSRLEGAYPSIFGSPDVSGPDLVAVAAGLLALPARST